MKFGLKEIKVHFGAFDFIVVCIVGKSDNVEKYINWKFDDKEFSFQEAHRGYDPMGACYFRKGYVPVIWIPRKPKTPRELATLSHECIHACFHLFEWMGSPINQDTEETLAHAHRFLLQSILEKA